VDFVNAYDYLTEARARLFDWVRPLTQEQYTQQFPSGHGTLRATLIHTATAEWAYNRRLKGDLSILPPLPERPINETRLPAFADLERAWTDLARDTRATLTGVSDWNTPLEYQTVTPGGTMLFTVTRGEFALQLCFHEIHHRAQAMAMLRQLGVQAQSIDYSVLKFRRRQV
jgi:uncharacterized damage-inducible protein DinB